MGTRAVNRPATTGGQEDRAGEREEPHAGLQRGQTEDVLQVEDEIGEQREQRRRDRPRRGEAAVEGRHAEQPEVEHRLPLPQLDDDEGEQQDRRRDRANRRPSSTPSRRRWLGSGRTPEPRRAALKVTKPSQSGRWASGSRDSSTRIIVTTIAATPIGMLTKKIQRHDRPLVIAPPSTGPDRDRDTGDGTERAERDAAFPAVERLCHERQRGREHDRAADALQGPGERQEQRARRERRTATSRAVKTTIPMANTRRRPTRSAIDPAVSSNAASDSA